jgi:hypothetical protein
MQFACRVILAIINPVWFAIRCTTTEKLCNELAVITICFDALYQNSRAWACIVSNPWQLVKYRWARSRYTVIILYTVYLLLAHLVYTCTWIMKLWYIWNSVSFQNRCVELLEQVHTVLRAHIRMPKVDCSSLLLYVYVYLYLVNIRRSRFERMSVLMLNTIRAREELLKFKLHSYHILPKGAVFSPLLSCMFAVW